MTETEAENKAKLMDMSRSQVFCPAIKEMCRTDCECYKRSKPYLESRYTNEYGVIEGHCVNSNLHGKFVS